MSPAAELPPGRAGSTADAAPLTGKRRKLHACRGISAERPPVAPAFSNYFPAKALGVDMIAWEREIPQHLALKTVCERFGCEGSFSMSVPVPNGRVDGRCRDVLERGRTDWYASNENIPDYIERGRLKSGDQKHVAEETRHKSGGH
jgi:hypothetical protein